MKETERTLLIRLPQGCSDDALADLDLTLSSLLRTPVEVETLQSGAGQRTDVPAAASVSRIEIDPDTEDEYLRLRRDVINPGMAQHDGFLDTILLRPQNRSNEYLLINLWISSEDYEGYRGSRLHDDLKAEAMRLLPKPLEIFVADVVRLD